MKRLLLLLVVLAGSLLWAGTAGATNGRVLILDSTVQSGVLSYEATAASNAGEGVDLVNGAQWSAMSTSDFAQYDAIILGDPSCAGDPSPAGPAIANASTWEPAVTGNVILIGTDPTFHTNASNVGAHRLINNGVGFSFGDAGRTGLYLSLSCYYFSSPSNTPVSWLDGLSSFGGFSVRGQFAFGTGCPARSHIVATAPVLSGLTDADLSNWGCSAHESFDTFPADFNVLVINEDIAQTYTASDGTQGGPYILVRGREVHVISDITLSPASATNPVGTPHTVTATVTENGSPVGGTLVSFTVTAGPNAGLTGSAVTDVSGQASFTYTSAVTGTDLIRASFTDSTGHVQTSDAVSKTWTGVTEQPITASGGFTVNGTDAAPASGTVATFTDPDSAATASEYTATIDWGDGSPTDTGTITGGTGGPFTVSGSHQYAAAGNYTITVTITDTDTATNTQTVTSTGSVTDAAISATNGSSFNGTEPAAVSGTVASFTDPNTSATAADYSASIDWGDGTPATTGTISGGSGSFDVSGSHTYTDEGAYSITVVITDNDEASNTATANSSATIVDASLAASGMSLVSPQAFAGPVASFTDANATATSADFTATIDWGDGHTTGGTVSGGGGSFTVSGSHTYAASGSYTVTVDILDDGGSTAEATTTILVFGSMAGGGSFVIGNGNAALGSSVLFWGAQWWKENSLAGGPAPAAFKGFANRPAAIGCGTSWTTSPGNSPPPPAGPLPAYIAVIVSSSIGQSGSTISGNTVHMVVVKTNGGYANDPGHPGTGKVVARIC